MKPWTPEDATRELLAVSMLLNRMMGAELRVEAGEDTTMPQYRVMALLDTEPQTLSALAKKRRVSLQAASELVQVLVERGWITRTPNPEDRRQSLLQLSELGRAQYFRAQGRILEHLIPILEKLNSEELQSLQQGLPALHQALINEEVERQENG